MRLDQGQRLIIGHTSSVQLVVEAKLQVHGTAQSFSMIRYNVGVTTPSTIQLGKTRSTVIGTFGTAVVDGDVLSSIITYGDDGTDIDNPSSSLDVLVDNTVAADQIPSAFRFRNADASGSLIETGKLDSRGTFYVGDTGDIAGASSTNLNMTIGITVVGDGSDNEFFAGKDTDIATGLTDVAETDTFFFVEKIGPGGGGAAIHGIIESGSTPGLRLLGYGGTADTTPSTTSLAFVHVVGYQYSGTSLVNSTTNALIFGVRTQIGGVDRDLMFVDAEGDIHVDGSTTLQGPFDEFEDAQLGRALDLLLNPDRIIRGRWDEFVKYGKEDLEKAGIISNPNNGADPMVNVTQLQRLHSGTLWQLYIQQQDMTERERCICETADELIPGFMTMLNAKFEAAQLPAFH